jgi:hypothetical protein
LATVDELWLGAFQRLCDAAAHGFKGAMNGVALNLEVVRSRSARDDGVEAAGLRTFADAAASEFESVIQSAEAMLALARTPRGATDVARIVRDVAVLAARGGPAGTHITVDRSVERLGTSSTPASAARLAVAAVLLAAVERSPDVVCDVVPDSALTGIKITAGERGGSGIALGEEVVAAVRSAGVHLDITESGATITFPT